jgi:hypothetical protein
MRAGRSPGKSERTITMFAHIRKLVVAIVGLALLLVHQHFGLDLLGMEPVIVDTVIAILTAIGIYTVPNEPERSS